MQSCVQNLYKALGNQEFAIRYLSARGFI